MPTKLAKLFIIAALALSGPLACKDKDADKQEAPVKALDAAKNGSPVAVEFVKFIGEGDRRGMEVLLYNGGDKTAVAYHFLFRYYDADDKLLKTKVGTPFESDTDFTSMSGNKFKCEPKRNATLEIDGDIISVPAAATRAEIYATSVRSLADDGVAIDDWWQQENFGEWPAT